MPETARSGGPARSRSPLARRRFVSRIMIRLHSHITDCGDIVSAGSEADPRTVAAQAGSGESVWPRRNPPHQLHYIMCSPSCCFHKPQGFTRTCEGSPSERSSQEVSSSFLKTRWLLKTEPVKPATGWMKQLFLTFSRSSDSFCSFWLSALSSTRRGQNAVSVQHRKRKHNKSSWFQDLPSI